MSSKILNLMIFGTILFCSGCLSQEKDQDLPSTPNPTQTELNLVLAEPLSDFSPLSFQSADRKYLSQIYEPLIQFDSTFNITSSLAISWGRTDELTWSFKIRKGVLFHDGTPLTAEDARASIEAARLNPISELSSLLGPIEAVKATEVDRLEVKTKGPDPLLLNRLAQVYITPKGKTPKIPIGTGAYRFESYEKGALNLKRFEAYWGTLAHFEIANFTYLPNPEERLSALRTESADVLMNVPAEAVEPLKNEGYLVEVYPALELSSLFLNPKGLFKSKDLREAVALTLQHDYASPFAQGFLIPTEQLAASGIFGYQNNSGERTPNLQKALDLRSKIEGPITLTIDLPLGLEALGEALARDLSAIAIDVKILSHQPQDLEKKILSKQSEAYFLGWKYDLGDSADFLEAALHSTNQKDGKFNGLEWSNTEVDQLLEEAAQTLDVEKRRELLQQSMKKIQEAYVVFPLFESQSIVAIKKNLSWTPRLDGLLLASEILPIVVE